MKISMYELLGMVKDGKAPYKIKYQNEIYTMDDLEYFYFKNENRTPLFAYIFDYYNDYDALNEEVEILEEEKKIPERLKIEQDTPNSNYYIKDEHGTKCGLTKHSKMIAEKLNQVIDYLESKGE